MELIGVIVNKNVVNQGVLVNKTLALQGAINVSGQPIPIGGEVYTGEYTVTPKVRQQTILQTQLKVMSDNVTVLQIPDYEVSNPQGGKTFIIGGNN